jgi:ASC-1-like (ASCH) protein
MTHELKCWPEYFGAVWCGKKNFEVRKNDRGYRVGDELILREWNPNIESYTGRMLRMEVTYILDDPAFVKEGYVIMGIQGA